MEPRGLASQKFPSPILLAWDRVGTPSLYRVSGFAAGDEALAQAK